MNSKYTFSEDLIKNRKILMAMLVLFIPVSMTIFLFSFSNGEMANDLTFMVKLVVGVTLFFTVEVVIIAKIMFKKLRSNTLILDELQIQRSGGRYTESMYYADIVKLKTSTNPSGDVELIKINTAKGTLKLAGYENMTEIASHIKTQVDPKTKITEKQWKINWNNPYISIVYFVLVIVFYLLVEKVSTSARHFISPIINICLALYFILFKPISQSTGQRFRLLELVVGGFMLVLSIYNLSHVSKVIDILG